MNREEEGEKTVNAPRHEPHARTRTTYTFWPGVRRPEPPAAPRTPDTAREDPRDDEDVHVEPGYGHGV